MSSASMGNAENESIEMHRQSDNARSSEPPASPNIVALVSEWLSSHSDLLKKMSGLMLADARLAAISGVQLAGLTFAFSILFVCTIIIFDASLMLLLMWLGVSLSVAVTSILTLHLLMLFLLYIAIKSSYEGLKFNATRASVFGPSADSETTDNAKVSPHT